MGNIRDTIRQEVKKDKKLDTVMGQICNLELIGEGGNSLVFSGLLYGHDVAVKLLCETESNKKSRFLSEYVNILLLERKDGLVQYLNYGEIEMKDCSIPYYIMRKYENTLESYTKQHELNETVFLRLFEQIGNALCIIHTQDIIHRDIKQQNILVDEEGNFYLSDFGIAQFAPEKYELTGHTEIGERLANYQFAAPEQRCRPYKYVFATDIYCFGRLLQWYVGKYCDTAFPSRIKDCFGENPSKKITILESIIQICVEDDLNKRFDSAMSMMDYYEKEITKKEYDPFDDIYVFDNLIRSSCPEAFTKLMNIKDQNEINRIMSNLSNSLNKFGRKIWFMAGWSSSEIENVKQLETSKWLINQNEVKISSIWLISDYSEYRDLMMLEVDVPEPYIIDGIPSTAVACIDGSGLIDINDTLAGYYRKGGEIIKLGDHDVEYRYQWSQERMHIFIGPQYLSTMNPDNEKEYEELPQRALDIDEMYALWERHWHTIEREIYLRL